MNKILIVDDKAENIYTLRQLLQGINAEIVSAGNGNDALIATLNHDFAVALLDVQMPGMSGYELAELLRGSKATANLPIIFLSAVYSDDYHVFKGYEAGGVDFLVKPFDPKILINKINIFLQLDKQRQELLQAIELERSRNYLESILMAVNDAIIVTTPDGTIETVNRAVIDLLEQPPSALVGTPVTHWLPDNALQEWIAHPVSGTAVANKQTAAPTPLGNIELCLPQSDGSHLVMLLSGSFLHDKAGVVSGRVLAAIDITAHKEREALIQQQATELSRSNTELSRFAYVASHDLQEPLRMITSYVQLLAHRYQGQLDEKADQYIHFAVDGAQRMKGLLDGLLSYSRVNTQFTPFAPTNMEQVLTKALANVSLLAEQSGAKITHDALPTIPADSTQMLQLLQNLLANALKYRAGERPPLIHVSAVLEGNRWQFSVKDNGIGIPKEQFERIFLIFQRLHTREEIDGLGLGLAICQRIVERHNGRIAVESVVGQGSTFTFSLPTTQPGSSFNAAEPDEH